MILASYGSDLARKHGRRSRQVARSGEYQGIFGTVLSSESGAVDEWALTNGSEYMAGGIMSGMTGNRANGIVIDDPVKGRDEADSEVTRKRTREAYEDDLLTRLLPGGWVLIIQTRWNEADLAGGILPEGWRGESGLIRCRDGQDWNVLCLPAKCERPHDPLGRQIGEYLWPEWFDQRHWAQFENNSRTWSALYQQRPSPETGDYWKAEWLRPYVTAPDRATLSVYGASDYAVTSGGGDYTVHIVVGIDTEDKPWLLDLWRGQSSPDVWVDHWCDLVKKWKPFGWAEETGQITKSIGPFLSKRANERQAYVAREEFPTSGGDKGRRAQSMRGRIAQLGLQVPTEAPWFGAFKSELMSFPAGAHDDQVDALGLIGQLLDLMATGRKPKEAEGRVDRGYAPAKSEHVDSFKVM